MNLRSRTTASRHLDTAIVLDYLEGLLAAPDRAAVEDHLATACARCREAMRSIGMIHGRMTADRVPGVPASVRARALEVFVPRPAATPDRAGVRHIARLVFDSLRTPLPAMARRTVGDARRLRWALGEQSLEVEYETGEPGTLVLRGRIDVPEPSLYRIEVTVGSESLTTWPDARGSFVFERVPSGRLHLMVTGPSGTYRIPAFTP